MLKKEKFIKTQEIFGDHSIFAAMFYNHTDAQLIVNTEGDILKTNTSFVALSGYGKASVSANSFFSLFPRIEQTKLKAIFDRIIKNELEYTPQTFEAVFMKKTGLFVAVQCILTPIVLQSKDIFIGVILKENGRQITTKSFSDLTFPSQLYYFIEYNHDAIAIIDGAGQFVHINSSFEKIFGWNSAEVQNTGFTLDKLIPDKLDIYGMHEEDEILQSNQVYRSFETLRKKKDGSIFPVLLSCYPLPSTDGGWSGTIMVVKDLTEWKQTEEYLRQNEKLSIVGQLAAGIVHEIRNPLTALKGFVKLMQEFGGRSDERYLEVMATELTRIELILGELLVLAKPKPVFFKKESVDIIMQNVLQLIEMQASMKEIKLQLNIQSDLKSIECDPNQLKQVFINLIKNSIEAMDHGGIIRIDVIYLDIGAVEVVITDEGCGIDEEELPRLGEPFYTTKPSGTGLGLMNCMKIIENHKGSIDIMSKIDQGTTVKVRLPASQESTRN